MARLTLEKADHPELETLPREIITVQEREIKTMREHASAMHH